MLKTRLIPVILLKDGNVVKSKNFKSYQFVGNPFEDVERFNQWKVDELIYLNINGILFKSALINKCRELGFPEFSKDGRFLEYIPSD